MFVTTKFVQNVVYIVTPALLLFFVSVATSMAQSNNLTPSEVVALEESTTTEDIGTSTPTSPTSPTSAAPVVAEVPWFRVEQLSGTVNQGDFVVGPGRAEVEVRPGETLIYEISVSNRISDNRVFTLKVEDVAGSSDGSQSAILLGDERGPYTLKDYITFPKNSFTLKLGERARIPVSISIPGDAEPGGLYGSVLISTVSEDGDDGGGVTRSPIIARIGTLFFVTVPGDINTGGETKSISLSNNSWWFEKGPIKFNILYENTGSIHLNPYGELRIKNIFDEEVGFLELEPWFSLPKSFRSREISWDRELLFGRYTATAFVNRGYDDLVDEVTVAFWVLPWKIMLGIFSIIFIVLFGLRFFFRNFEFKRRG